MSVLQKLTEGIVSRDLSKEGQALLTKWEKTGLLEGIEGDTEKSGMAVLLENQAKQLIDEGSRTGTSAGSEEWSGVALPLVRRVFAEIAAKEFVSVQPMNLPSGLIFYLDFKYGTDQSLQGKGGSLFGGTSAAKLGSTDKAEGGLYGKGRHGYSINDKTIAVSVGDGIPANADLEGVRAFKVVATADGAETQLDAENKSTADGVLHYHVQTVDSDRGDFEDNLGDSADAPDTGTQKDVGIPEVNLELKSEPIVAKTRKLKAVWTPELAQDLNAYHSIDAEAELTSLLHPIEG